MFIKVYSDKRNGQKEVISKLDATSATANLQSSSTADRYGQNGLNWGEGNIDMESCGLCLYYCK